MKKFTNIQNYKNKSYNINYAEKHCSIGVSKMMEIKQAIYLLFL